ncbi:MAG: DUF3987 domain-containing protein, partial [Candidatus Limnocylindrales bacterium]
MSPDRQSTGQEQTRPARGEAWEEPTPLDVIDVRPLFPVSGLPAPLRDWIEAEAEAVQVPVDLPAMVTLAALATVCAGHARVEAGPGWEEGLNLYTIVA